MAEWKSDIRSCTSKDVEGVLAFVRLCPPLEVHTAFTYWVTLSLWGDTCCVAVDGKEIIGYASAIGDGRSPESIYIWQVGVQEAYRGRGLSQALIGNVVGAARDKGFRRAQVSIAPENTASLGAFRRLAGVLGQDLEELGEVSFRDSDGKDVREILYEFEIS